MHKLKSISELIKEAKINEPLPSMFSTRLKNVLNNNGITTKIQLLTRILNHELESFKRLKGMGRMTYKELEIWLFKEKSISTLPKSFKPAPLNVPSLRSNLTDSGYGLKVGDTIEFPALEDAQVLSHPVRPGSDAKHYLVKVNKNGKEDFLSLNYLHRRYDGDPVGETSDYITYGLTSDYDRLKYLCGKTIRVKSEKFRGVPVFDVDGRRKTKFNSETQQWETETKQVPFPVIEIINDRSTRKMKLLTINLAESSLPPTVKVVAQGDRVLILIPKHCTKDANRLRNCIHDSVIDTLSEEIVNNYEKYTTLETLAKDLSSVQLDYKVFFTDELV